MPVLMTQLPNADVFKNEFLGWLREQAGLTRGIAPGAKKGPELLELLATHVHTLPPGSEQLHSLQAISSRLPRLPGSEGRFVPSPFQARIVGNIGQVGDVPKVEESLNELIAVGFDDALAAVAKEQGERANKDAAERIRRAEEAANLRVFKAEERMQTAEEKFHHAEAEVADLRKRVEHLAAVVEGKPESKP
jgi:hypothetical protein